MTVFFNITAILLLCILGCAVWIVVRTFYEGRKYLVLARKCKASVQPPIKSGLNIYDTGRRQVSRLVKRVIAIRDRIIKAGDHIHEQSAATADALKDTVQVIENASAVAGAAQSTIHAVKEGAKIASLIGDIFKKVKV
jgi:hypothetical protein